MKPDFELPENWRGNSAFYYGSNAIPVEALKSYREKEPPDESVMKIQRLESEMDACLSGCVQRGIFHYIVNLTLHDGARLLFAEMLIARKHSVPELRHAVFVNSYDLKYINYAGVEEILTQATFVFGHFYPYGAYFAGYCRAMICYLSDKQIAVHTAPRICRANDVEIFNLYAPLSIKRRRTRRKSWIGTSSIFPCSTAAATCCES